jgi:diadenosine tetraphosphate (Ap4A) HIT family hydrolase
VTCTACRFVAEGNNHLLRRDGFILHAIAQPTPVKGWLVLTSERHTRAWYDLTREESAALGSLAREVMQAQLKALHAEHVYAFAIGDVLQHFHLHLIPRFLKTPSHHRGRAAFDAPATEAISETEAAAAANEVKTWLSRSDHA